MNRAGSRVLAWILGISLCAVGAAAPSAPATRPSAGPKADFVRDIQPILASHCYECHGPAAQKGKLRWDRRDSVLQRDVIKPGSPQSSTLIEVVTSHDPDTMMPPDGKGTRLSVAQVATLTAWIEQGAPWPDAAAEAPDYRLAHWSFHRPGHPPIPPVGHPEWVRNPIDAFVLVRLQRERLAPAPEADRYALIRRVSLDLTGLPPTPAQVDAFLNDPSANAYENLVDRLLASPAYGERWAQVWLDLARYADSRGYASDSPRTIWRWRDWVIQSINANMPYDQFTIEQLAGDLLPHATKDQILATAFHRNTMTNDEGGTDDEEFRVAAVKDRVSTTMQVWMGLTAGCAECHDHKYDPITQRDYYRLFALFNQTEDADRGDESPRLSMALPQFEAQVAKLEVDIAALEGQLDRSTPELEAEQARWEAELGGGIRWTLAHGSMESKAGATLVPQPDGAVLVTGKDAATDVYTIRLPASDTPVTAIRLEALSDDALPKKGPGRAYSGSFVLTHFAVQIDDPARDEGGPGAREARIVAAYADYAQKGMEIAKAIDAPNPALGWSVDGEIGKPHHATFVLGAPAPRQTPLVIRLDHLYGTEGATLGKFRLSVSSDPQAGRKAAIPTEILRILDRPVAQRTPAEAQQLAKYYRASISPTLKAVRDQIAALRKNVAAKSVETPVMRDLPLAKHRKSHMLARGNFLEKGDEVTPGVPAFLPQPREGIADRLALARWLVSGENPLTARVTVNRYWEHLFGVGLVSTSDDFGMRGKDPSHPELLDWLAGEFVRQRWDVKGLLRLIVTSSTYRQSSRIPPELLERDPQNQLLAHGPRFRCSAETVRDQALFIAGLLSPKLGGPSVRPLQPRLGLSAAFGGTTDWTPSEGPDRHRRALYTSWRRLSPYPSLIAFDAPNRNVCALKRPRTNTPLQALVTLNDPVYVEAAQGLARRMIREGGDTVESRLAYGFRLCLARPPREPELKRLAAAYQEALNRYEANPAAADAMAGDPIGPVPEGLKPANLAAWTVMGNVLLNLDEMFAKR